MFDADRPILKSEQDRLGRSVFAKYLARCILDHTNPDSFVIGLYGGWGSGKTSLINLTLEELHIASNNTLDEEKPIILNFSPWSYSGQNQLIYSFFRRLSSEIRHSPYVENTDEIIRLLELYVSFFTHQPVPIAFRAKQSPMAKLRSRKEDAFGWESGRDLTQVKMELNNLLRQQKHKIIIFIDNIARIEDHEIKQIFQIAKSMGDYANTIYVLAMDKPHIIRAMDHVFDGDGVEYLEKIVQLPFDIPAICKQDLENILFDRLNQIVNTMTDNRWDTEYWIDLYYSSLHCFFKDCRDITRYVNTLNFSFARVKDLVNPVDFFAIVALEVFAPQVFNGIRDNKDLFTDFVSHVFEPDHETCLEDKLRCDEIINRADPIPQEILQQLLIRLFPELRRIYQTNVPFYHSNDLARRNQRICSADVFDIYFQLSFPTNSMSAAEMNAILKLTQNETGFSQAILRLNKDERIKPFLDLFDSYAVNKIPLDDIPNVAEALINAADLFPEGKKTAMCVDMPMQIHRILHQLLRRFNNPDERFEIFRNAIKKTTMSLYIFIHELVVQSNKHLESEDTLLPLDQHDFTPEQLEILKKMSVAKILYWAEIGRLAEHPKLLEILSAWKSWGDPEECSRFVGFMVQEDRGLITFLCYALKEPIAQAMTKLAKNPDWQMALGHIENFISVNILEAHARMIFEDPNFEKLREPEQLAILIFLDLIHAETVKVIPQV